jgi:hypothetical protein
VVPLEGTLCSETVSPCNSMISLTMLMLMPRLVLGTARGVVSVKALENSRLLNYIHANALIPDHDAGQGMQLGGNCCAGASAFGRNKVVHQILYQRI